MFGDPTCTVKPVLDDLRAAKPTALLALARRRATPAQRARLTALIGHPNLDEDGASEVRAIFTTTGAPVTVEHMITERCQQASAAIDSAPLPPATTAFLRDLITHATARDY